MRFYGKSNKPRSAQIERKSQRIVKRGAYNIIRAVNNKNSLIETFLFTPRKLSEKVKAVKDRLLVIIIKITAVRKNIALR